MTNKEDECLIFMTVNGDCEDAEYPTQCCYFCPVLSTCEYTCDFHKERGSEGSRTDCLKESEHADIC